MSDDIASPDAEEESLMANHAVKTLTTDIPITPTMHLFATRQLISTNEVLSNPQKSPTNSMKANSPVLNSNKTNKSPSILEEDLNEALTG